MGILQVPSSLEETKEYAMELEQATKYNAKEIRSYLLKRNLQTRRRINRKKRKKRKNSSNKKFPNSSGESKNN